MNIKQRRVGRRFQVEGRACARALGWERENLFRQLKDGQGSWGLESKDRDMGK